MVSSTYHLNISFTWFINSVTHSVNRVNTFLMVENRKLGDAEKEWFVSRIIEQQENNNRRSRSMSAVVTALPAVQTGRSTEPQNCPLWSQFSWGRVTTRPSAEEIFNYIVASSKQTKENLIKPGLKKFWKFSSSFLLLHRYYLKWLCSFREKNEDFINRKIFHYHC